MPKLKKKRKKEIRNFMKMINIDATDTVLDAYIEAAKYDPKNDGSYLTNNEPDAIPSFFGAINSYTNRLESFRMKQMVPARVGHDGKWYYFTKLDNGKMCVNEYTGWGESYIGIGHPKSLFDKMLRKHGSVTRARIATVLYYGYFPFLSVDEVLNIDDMQVQYAMLLATTVRPPKDFKNEDYLDSLLYGMENAFGHLFEPLDI